MRPRIPFEIKIQIILELNLVALNITKELILRLLDFGIRLCF